MVETQNGVTKARLNSSGETMHQFALRLSNQLDRPVLDGTGLTGKYDILIIWQMDNPGSAPADSSDVAGPGLASVLDNELGLKLTFRKATVGMVVVDRSERVPTEN